MSEPHEWAAASCQAAATNAVGYGHKRNDACWYDTNNKRLDEEEDQRTIQMTDDYLDAFKPVVELRLKQAGVRLAQMINLAFDPDYDPETIDGDLSRFGVGEGAAFREGKRASRNEAGPGKARWPGRVYG